VDPSKYEDRWERYLAKTHENVRQTLEKYIESKNRIKLLDVSTGSGKLHEYLAKSNLNLSEAAFNDPDREMLSKDRKQVIRDALDCKTTFYHEDMGDLHKIQQEFDVIISQNAYHLYPDKQAFFETMNALTHSKSLLLVMDWDNHTWFKLIYQVIKLFDDKPLSAESHNQVTTRASHNQFRPISCKTWRWKWWKFFTIVLTPNHSD
jgi:ubiquinone/menaquinone biosynthesis C-methylase UbiE